MAVVIVGGAWVLLLAAIARLRVFLTSDTVSNHVHVWWIARNLWHGHGIPLRMPVLASGDAFTFPYGSVPWIAAALTWPLAGDHVVSVWLAGGALATIAATFWALPVLRRGWWAVLVLVNPSLITSVLLGQLPFLWATASLFMGIGMWRRGRLWWAIAFTALANLVHPAVMLPISALVVLARLPFEPRKLRLLGAYALSVVAALPAVALTFASPVMGQTTRRFQMYSLGTTVAMRLVVVALPLVYAVLARLRVRWLPVALSAVSLVLVLGPMWRTFGLDVGWRALSRQPSTELDSFLSSPDFVPGRTYRVLTGGDAKWGPYQVVKAGGVLDSEFFPESLHRSSFPSAESYAGFLAERRVQSVVFAPSYHVYYRSNEGDRLAELASRGTCIAGVTVRLARTTPNWSLYDVAPC